MGVDPQKAPRTRDQSIARATVVVSSVNLIALQLFGSLGIAINLSLYLAAHDGASPPKTPGSRDLYSHNWIGQLPLPVPWWAFALSGVILLAVAVISWSPARRFQSSSSRVPAVYRTTPGFLAIIGLVCFATQFGVIGYYDGVVSVLSPYVLGPLLCLVATGVAFRRWQLDAPALSKRERDRRGVPSRLAEIMGSVLLVDLLVLVVFGFGGVVVNQLVYLSAHSWSPPATSQFLNTGWLVWPGRMPVDLPWWFLVLVSAVLLIVVVVTWPPANQLGPQLPGRVALRRTTAPALVWIALLVVLAEESIIRFYSSGSMRDPATIAVGIGLLAALLAAVRWFLDRRRESLALAATAQPPAVKSHAAKPHAAKPPRGVRKDA